MIVTHGVIRAALWLAVVVLIAALFCAGYYLGTARYAAAFWSAAAALVTHQIARVLFDMARVYREARR